MPLDSSRRISRRAMLGTLAASGLAGCQGLLDGRQESAFTQGPASWSPGSGDVRAETWPMARHDARRSGTAPENTGPEPPLERHWTAATDVGSFYPPVEDGRVFASHWRGTLLAMDAETGKIQWRFETNQFLQSSPTVSDGTVYVHESLYPGDDRPDVIRAFDAATGTSQWTYKLEQALGSALLVSNGILYVTCADRLLALDAQMGELAWEYQTGGPHRRVTSVVLDAETVYATAHADNIGVADDPDPVTGTVFALDPATESVKWSIEGYQPTEVATAGETVLVRDFDDRGDGLPNHTLFAFSQDTGDQRWQAKLRPHDLEQVSTVPQFAVVDETVYHQIATEGNSGPTIAAVSLADGTEKARYGLGYPRSHNRTPLQAIAGDRLYTVTSRWRNEHWIDVIDLVTKTRLETTHPDNEHLGLRRAGAPVVAGDTLFIGGRNEGVVAFHSA